MFGPREILYLKQYEDQLDYQCHLISIFELEFFEQLLHVYDLTCY